jgi:phage-related protein
MGYNELQRVKLGLEPSNYKNFSEIGLGVKEIKLQGDNKEQYRIIYIAKFEEAIYIIHVITRKTTEQTSDRDKKMAKKRYNEIIEYRKRKK